MAQNRSRNRRRAQQQSSEEEEAGLRYAPLRDFYSEDNRGGMESPPLVHVYSRNRTPNPKPSLFDSLVARFGDKFDDTPSTLVSAKTEPQDEEEENEEEGEAESMEEEEQKEENKAEKMKRKREELSKKWLRPKREPTSLDANTIEPRVQNGNKVRKAENVGRKRKHGASENGPNADENGVPDSTAKKWVRLSFEGVDPEKFIGLQSKIYWPLDDDWYDGHIVGYNAETGRHQVSYEDGDKENVMLSIEKIKFHVSPDEMQRLNLKYSTAAIADGLNFSEMVVLAAGFDDDHDLGPGDIIWAKLAGHAMWPAVIVDDSVLVNRKGLNRISEGKSVSVQFFGTHDFARVNVKQVISFLKGLLSSFHLKCKKPNFLQSLEEAKTYLSEQHLPERMLMMQNGEKADNCDFSGQEDEENYNTSEDCNEDKELGRKIDGSTTCPIEIGDLRVIRLGSIVKDSKFFQDGKVIWPEGYTAARKFSSITDPSVHALYKMEVLRDVDSRLRPLFRVTVDGEQFKGSTPTACWNKIYKRIRKMHHNSGGLTNEGRHGSNTRLSDSGSEMFGFSNPEVMKLIKQMSNSKNTACKWISRRSRELPVGYRPVQVKWKDLDKCSVCDMDEEYEDNLFLQCDRCRIMVHAKCYGELEPVDGVLWLCNLCRPGAPKYSPPCCLCPVKGGAMKPTTDGRWAHLACAIWIPETCLLDVKKMEPIDGLSQVNKDRWKLLCSICGVSYGACIQCSNNSCRVAYHPLCARVAGFCIELADETKLHLINTDEDEDKQCFELHSFCKKHSPPSRERLKADNRTLARAQQVLENIPPSNPSGCARTEPFNFLGRRGRKEPDALAAASLKRLFVEDKPYLVRGVCRHETSVDGLSSVAFSGCKVSSNCQIDVPNSIHSMIEKFRYMRTTTRKRLAFGKSGIHGFGIFAKQPHRAGDMVIEYTGELVRPPIADRREHLIYNSLVGAGTYMFRIDNERVIDATRAGSIAHLINHSCEPNCYSRVITVNGDQHIIIFAKRDIKQWEELTYDYRFMSIDEQLPCYCGHSRCRGVVNDIEAEELVAKLLVPSSELTELRGD